MHKEIDTRLVSDLEEAELLRIIFPYLPSNSYVNLGPGDDCAEITAPSGSFVVSTDVLIENVHFRSEWSSGYHVGWRAAMQNLADIAAMGAVPTSLVVGLAMPSSTSIQWVQEFAHGLGDAARSVGVACVGGDLSSAQSIFISVTVHGDPIAGTLTRSQARPGDVVALAGHTGWSAAGLDLLGTGRWPLSAVHTGNADAAYACELAVQTFRAPTSPIHLGEVAARAGATAMMDVSDGLVRDAQRMCKASGVSMILDYSALADNPNLPLFNRQLNNGSLPQRERTFTTAVQGLEHVASVMEAHGEPTQMAARAARWLLTGGEDHGLLATFPPEKNIPKGFIVIGRVRGGTPFSAGGQGPSEPDAQRMDAVENAPAVHDHQPATQFGEVRVDGVALDPQESGWDHFA